MRAERFNYVCFKQASLLLCDDKGISAQRAGGGKRRQMISPRSLKLQRSTAGTLAAIIPNVFLCCFLHKQSNLAEEREKVSISCVRERKQHHCLLILVTFSTKLSLKNIIFILVA